MTNDKDITRYEVNEHGELPLSYGRYVRWEDIRDLLEDMQDKIYALEEEIDDQTSYDDGYSDGHAAGYEEGQDTAWEEAREAYGLK